MARPYVPQRPTIDAHPSRDAIQRQLILRTPYTQIVRKFSKPPHTFSRTALANYHHNYVQPALDAARTTDTDRAALLRDKVHDTCIWLFDNYRKESTAARARAAALRRTAKQPELPAATTAAIHTQANAEQEQHRKYLSDLTRTVTSVGEVLGMGRFDPVAKQAPQQPGGATTLTSQISVAMAIGLPRDNRVPLQARTEAEANGVVVDVGIAETVEDATDCVATPDDGNGYLPVESAGRSESSAGDAKAMAASPAPSNARAASVMNESQGRRSLESTVAGCPTGMPVLAVPGAASASIASSNKPVI